MDPNVTDRRCFMSHSWFGPGALCPHITSGPREPQAAGHRLPPPPRTGHHTCHQDDRSSGPGHVRSVPHRPPPPDAMPAPVRGGRHVPLSPPPRGAPAPGRTPAEPDQRSARPVLGALGTQKEKRKRVRDWGRAAHVRGGEFPASRTLSDLRLVSSP